MDTFRHYPDELQAKIAAAGFATVCVYGMEGPGWLRDAVH